MSRLRTKSASNWVRDFYPKHVLHAVNTGKLPGPASRYLQKLVTRNGNQPRTFVIKTEDFLRVYM